MMEERLMIRVMDYFNGDHKRIQHFLKVHEFATIIGKCEGIDERTYETLTIAAIVHDIGIHKAEEQYGSCSGRLQEELGPGIAREILNEIGYPQEVIDRVCYLVAHHHTYYDIRELDYQILVEADFIVNFYEDKLNISSIEYVYETYFKTTTGKYMVDSMFLK